MTEPSKLDLALLLREFLDVPHGAFNTKEEYVRYLSLRERTKEAVSLFFTGPK